MPSSWVRILASVICGSSAFVHAQDETTAAPSSPAPRLPDGRVDFGGDGVWMLPNANTGFEARIVGRSPEDLFLPWTKAMYQYHRSNDSAYDPQGFCLPPGVPRAMGTPYPAEIVQDRDRILIIFEGGGHVWREIHMDGRQLPPLEELNPTYFGYSVGRYEDAGSTLVVESHGFNENTWISARGFMHTQQLRVVERYTRPIRETLHYEATIDDPGAYTQPWTVAWDIPWSEGAELQEYICQDNNKYLLDLEDDLGNPFFSDLEK